MMSSSGGGRPGLSHDTTKSKLTQFLGTTLFDYLVDLYMPTSPDLQMPMCGDVDIEEASIEELQRHMTEGRFTVRDLTRTYLKRIENVNPFTKLVQNADAHRTLKQA